MTIQNQTQLIINVNRTYDIDVHTAADDFARIWLEDLGTVELHDSFTTNVLVSYERLGGACVVLAC